MKELPENWKRTDNLPFVSVTMWFCPKDGLKVDSHSNHISHKPNIGTADGCDFNFFGSSCSSESVFELHGAPAIQKPLTPGRIFKTYFYCLPANEVLATAKATEALKTAIQEYLSELKTLVATSQESYDKSFGA